MKKINLPIILLLILTVFSGCARKDSEEVISTYPGGEKRETAIFSGKKPNRIKLKSFEYYETGQKKREYHYKDNHYYGEWTYWYKDGSTIAGGFFDTKVLNPHKGTGSGTYYWPSGKEMIQLEVKMNNNKKVSDVIYRNESGAAYNDENLPDELKEKIQSVLVRWDKGEI